MIPGSPEAWKFREEVAKAMILRVIATGEWDLHTVYMPERVVEYSVSYANSVVELLNKELK